MRKWHADWAAMVVRTAGVHAGRGDCNRAVEVCVSGFGNPNRNRGGDNPGERFQRVLQRLVGRWAVACAGRLQARRDAQKKDVTGSYIQAVIKGKKTQQYYSRTQAEGFAMTRRREWNGRRFEFVSRSGEATRVEAKTGGEWEDGGEGGKERPAGQAKLREGGEEQAARHRPVRTGVWSGQWAGK